MAVPELPNYLTMLGGEDYKGLIIALFTLNAGLSRPFSGKLTDSIGRIPVMVFGTLVAFLCGFLYIFVSSVSLFLLVRFIHGFSTGFKPTATSAYVADITPVKKRGEAMGLLSTAAGAGMAAGPAVGSLITLHYGINWMFVCSSLTALASIIILLGMEETLFDKQQFKGAHLRVSWKDTYEPRVMQPAIIMILTTYSFGLVLTIIPDYSNMVGIQNKGLFFSLFTFSSLFVRLVGGKLSDKYGRKSVVIFACFCFIITLTLLACSNGKLPFYAAAIIFGFGTGTNAPTLFAWATDLASDKYRGRAMSTIYIALEIGIGFGSILSAELYDNNANQFSRAFLSSAILCTIAIGLLLKWTIMEKNVNNHI